jgi:type IV pilus assembly protein PilV
MMIMNLCGHDPRLSRRAARGFALLEALVGMLIFSFAVLGLVGLQASMTRAQTMSQFHAQASELAADLIGRMWSDVPNVAQYDSSNCASYNPCSSWQSKVATTLPGGTPNVSVLQGTVTITLTWTPPGETSSSQYVTATAVH